MQKVVWQLIILKYANVVTTKHGIQNKKNDTFSLLKSIKNDLLHYEIIATPYVLY